MGDSTHGTRMHGDVVESLMPFHGIDQAVTEERGQPQQGSLLAVEDTIPAGG